MKPFMVISHGDAMALAHRIIDVVHRRRLREQITIHMAVGDVRVCAEESRRQGDWIPRSTIKGGDEFSLWGCPGIAVDNITPGIAYLVERSVHERP